MEVLNLPISRNSLSLSAFSPFTSKFSIKTSNKRNPYLYNVPSSKFHKNPSFPCYLLSSTTRRLKVSVHFGGPTSRRNSLRKKLLHDQQVHQKNPIPLDVISSFVDNLNSDSVKESGLNNGFADDDSVVETSSSVKESKLKQIGESVLLNKLENWIDQYRKDVDYWGIGSVPIFTVFQDSEGNVKKVSVNEDEIIKRSQVKRDEFEDKTKTNSRIMYAKSLAREMESGGDVITRNSSVAKFVVAREESGFVHVICGVIGHPEFVPKISGAGIAVLCGLIVCWAVKELFSFRKKEVHYTELEKKMMWRKIKSRKEKEPLEKGNVEVVQVATEPPMVTFEKPKIDEQELMKNIIKVKASKDKLSLVDSSRSQTSKSKDFDDKIKEIRDMAKQIRETEGKEQSQVDEDEQEEHDVDGEFPDEIKVIEEHREGDVSFKGNISNGRSEQDISMEGTSLETFSVEANSMNAESPSKVASFGNGAVQTSSASSAKLLKDRQKINQDGKSSSHITVTKEVVQSSDTHDGKSCMSETNSIKMKPRVIRSVKEAREFLSRKCGGKQEFDQPLVNTLQEGAPVSRQSSNIESDKNMSQILEVDNKDFGPAIFDGTSESVSAPNASESSTMTDGEYGPIKKDYVGYSNEGYRVSDSQNSASSSIRDVTGGSTETRSSVKTENWMENNFHEVEPIVKKIGVGFRDNFMVAREKVNSDIDITQLASEDDDELEWMNDDKLREIVFHVQENELAGLDPFYLMDAEDKHAFFQGLEKKVEKVNEKLSHVHEFLHSNIENLDYGADGISLYDAPEKIIPRWKGPPLEKNPQVLDDYLKQRKTLFAANTGTSYLGKKDEENFLQNVTESPTHENTAATLATNELKKKQDKDPKHSKTVIEGSDGSVKSGKKSGKEYWQHTKKWTRGFLESYNAETDPEVKSAMKDIGKDLDRWITEEEIEEAAGLMTNLSDRNKKFMEKKLNKIKREMELFGPQAVVSKYNEYAEEKEEDYLWWLDLPHVLCIELYTNEGGGQRIGFYSLEMAADLELEPKPCHVIAFEDASDCKNLCYIIQAHLEMLGNGHAFVVPRPPKDAFREAKANGFSVTVIRQGELQQLNVDQTLEEVEEQITEIGSKMYHDMIMKGRSVDISSVMKGVLGGGDKPTKRKRGKRMLKRPSRK
ncbi:hypothetical protein LWI28_023973 [Acer negundo]|uniref:Embryo defective 1703 n=1 Tax=Acer negundo TaxID=4023 RepID=A0AAD5J2B1_ACENE|nr:hypothetical protein LWI28_023973 [Acer negundo]